MGAEDGRRGFLSIAGSAALLLLAGGARADDKGKGDKDKDAKGDKDKKGKKKDDDDVSATEDLMREHGVIRRVLVVYRESAMRLRAKGSDVSAPALHKAASLMRSFAEDYHERQLEEAHIFPAVKKAGGKGAHNLDALVDTLLAQHQRGRDITDYLLSATAQNIQDAAALAQALETFARMYEEHTAYEDTIIFPAWKKALPPKRLEEMGDLFEEIEHKTFGKDGFDDAVDKIGDIEKSLDIHLAALTAPPPPQH